MGCLTENEVLDLVEGRLGPAAHAELHQHVDQCVACRRLIAEATQVFASAGSTHPSTLPAPTEGALDPVALAGDIFDDYRIERPLGRGGFGRVYLGRDLHLDRPVALKLLAGVPDEKDRRRFRTEAQAVARLQHPNVMAVYRVGEVNGRPYLATEYIRGQDLRRLERPVSWQRALSIGLGLARGLGAAHRRGILHRDVKSANVMITPEGEVKLVDFGLAKLGNEGAPSTEGRGVDDALAEAIAPSKSVATSRLTGTGAVVGTPLYLAPEVYRGSPATSASDVYSTGVVLYELCTGHAPLEDPALGAVEQEQRPAPIERVPPLEGRIPGIDPAFAAVVDRCLRGDPAGRFSSGDELLEALERVGEPPPRAPTPRFAARARRAAPWLGAGLVAAAVVAYGLQRYGGARRPFHDRVPVVASPPEDDPPSTNDPPSSTDDPPRPPVVQLFLIATLPAHRGAMITLDGGLGYVGSGGDNKLFQVPLVPGSSAKLLYTSPGSRVLSRGSGIAGLEIQGDQIVWADHRSGSLFTAPKDGSGEPRAIREGLKGIWGFHTDATSLYWMDADGSAPGTLWKTPRAGGESEVVSAGNGGQGGDVLLNGPGGGFLMTNQLKGSLLLAPPGGGAATPWADLGGASAQIAEDEGAYYVGEIGTGSIVRIDKATRRTSTLISGMGQPVGVAVDATTVYWVTYLNPSVWGLRKTRPL